MVYWKESDSSSYENTMSWKILTGKAKQCENLTFLLKDNKLIKVLSNNPVVSFVSVLGGLMLSKGIVPTGVVHIVTLMRP